MIHISSILNEKFLGDEIIAGTINAREHDEAPLTIYNYSREASHIHKWTHEQRVCRGLIVDDAGYVVARPFEKFFNLNELPETEEPALPEGTLWACEKLDGCLGIIYWYQDRPYVATRGSFHSVMAQWATDWIRQPGNVDLDFLREWKDFTFIVEIISPVSRIVLDYQNDWRLQLIAIRDITTGLEFHPRTVADIAALTNMRSASYRRVKSINELIVAAQTAKGIEGDVVRIMSYGHDADHAFRFKVKTAEYIALHRLLKQISVRYIRQLTEAGTIDDYIDKLPAHIQGEVTRVRDILRLRRGVNSLAATLLYKEVYDSGPVDRPSFAARLTAYKSQYEGMVFLLYGIAVDQPYRKDPQRSLEEMAWKLVDHKDIQLFTIPDEEE